MATITSTTTISLLSQNYEPIIKSPSITVAIIIESPKTAMTMTMTIMGRGCHNTVFSQSQKA